MGVGNVVVAVLFLVLSIPLYMLEGAAVLLVYNWFVAPWVTILPHMTYAAAIGTVVLMNGAGSKASTPNVMEMSGEDIARLYITGAVTPVMVILSVVMLYYSLRLIGVPV